MAKGRGHVRKQESRRSRSAAKRRSQPTEQARPRTVEPIRGVAATRGPVTGAYRAWAADYGRKQAKAIVSGPDGMPGSQIADEFFALAPLTTRTIEDPAGQTISVQMGLPVVATRAGGIAVAPDRIAIAVLLLPSSDAAGAAAMLGLGQAPDLPQPDLRFALQLPAEAMRGVRVADAIAWYLAGLVEAGDVETEPGALGATVGEALALLRPNLAPRGSVRLDPSALDAYEGYGADTDTAAVPPGITAPPARGGLTGLPAGAFLRDSGAPLAPLLADLRDYVIGLWPYEYFDLEALTAPPEPADRAGRSTVLATLSDLVRRLDDVLAQSVDTIEAELSAQGHPPAWIAEESAGYRSARQRLRDTVVAQESLPLLGPIMFDLEIIPRDYMPPDAVGEIVDDEENTWQA